MHMTEFDVLLAAVIAQASRGLRCKAKQCLDRCRRLRTRAQFQQLAEQGQRDDHRGGLEIHADAPVFAERGREHVGGQRADHAVRECGAGTDADQGEHVRAAVADGLRAAFEERPARPQHHRRAQRKFQPGARFDRQETDAMAQHRQQEHNHGQRQRPPEAMREIAQLRVLLIVQGRHFRFQRHPADRAGARPFLADFRVHRTGVDRAGWSFRYRGCTRRL